MKSHGITPGCKGCARALTTSKVPINHNEQCRKRWEEKLIKDDDPRLLRQTERMYTEQADSGTAASSTENPAAPSTRRKEMPTMTEEDQDMEHDDDMEDGSSQAGIDGDDRMLMSLCPDKEIPNRINKTWHDINNKRKNRCWKDDVESMHEALRKEGIGNAVMEIFSKPRVNGMAERLGIMLGLSLDLTGTDKDDGIPWDFNIKAKRDKVMDIVLRKEALLLIGSPMCKSFSKLMNWDWKKMNPHKREKMIREGRLIWNSA